jgi:hypothetical protein
VLYGWSYFQEDKSGYHRSANWSDRECFSLILIGDKKAPPSRRQVLRDSLEWAVKLARAPEFPDLFVGAAEARPDRPRIKSGLAAYDAFAEGLERDADFPADNLEVLTSRLIPIANDGIYLMGCKRNAAARFLRSMAEDGFPGSEELKKAADAYDAEVKVWQKAMTMVPWVQSSEADRRRIADPKLRRELAALVREAKAHDERAVQCLERAHQALVTGKG